MFFIVGNSFAFISLLNLLNRRGGVELSEGGWKAKLDLIETKVELGGKASR
jgi:hypothetical protein